MKSSSFLPALFFLNWTQILRGFASTELQVMRQEVKTFFKTKASIFAVFSAACEEKKPFNVQRPFLWLLYVHWVWVLIFVLCWFIPINYKIQVIIKAALRPPEGKPAVFPRDLKYFKSSIVGGAGRRGCYRHTAMFKDWSEESAGLQAVGGSSVWDLFPIILCKVSADWPLTSCDPW